MNSHFRSQIIRHDSFSEAEVLDFSFGKKQIRQMLTDRPAMRNNVEEGDLLWSWTCNRFAGTEGCGPIFWDSSEPLSAAEQVPPRELAPGRIRVSKMTINGPSDGNLADKMWSCVVYELFNSCYGTYYTKVLEEAITGRISKKEFVKCVFTMEMLAIDDTREFYANVYLDWAEKKKAATNPANWFVTRWWGDKNRLFESCNDTDAYPWVPYGNYYDAFDEARQIIRLDASEPILLP